MTLKRICKKIFRLFSIIYIDFPIETSTKSKIWVIDFIEQIKMQIYSDYWRETLPPDPFKNSCHAVTRLYTWVSVKIPFLYLTSILTRTDNIAWVSFLPDV